MGRPSPECVRPSTGARCGKAARRDLRGGRRQLLSLPRQTSGADFLGRKPRQTPGKDRDEGNLDESNEMPPLEDGVQPTVAANPRQGALNDPANTLRNEGSTMATGAGLEGDAKRLLDSRCPR